MTAKIKKNFLNFMLKMLTYIYVIFNLGGKNRMSTYKPIGIADLEIAPCIC